jgi:hypothetical protein
MVRHVVVSTVIILALVATSQAAVITFTSTTEPTPGLPGYTTWTIRANSTHPMQGFDFAGDGSNRAPNAKGFFGRMNQLNPAGQPTVYSDNNPIITALGGDPKQDSQFLVRTGDVVVPAGFAEESGYHLQGIWAHAAPVGTQFDIAQIVMPNTAGAFALDFRGVITTLEGTSIVENHVQGSTLAPVFPRPQVVDATINAAVNSAVMHTFTATDAYTPAEFLGWQNFVFSGPGTANQPTFDRNTQAFHWDTTGSKPGTYTATVTVVDFHENFDTGTLTIHLVPEPAGAVLAGFMAMSWLLVRRASCRFY